MVTDMITRDELSVPDAIETRPSADSAVPTR
jgi:hypothetical protein